MTAGSRNSWHMLNRRQMIASGLGALAASALPGRAIAQPSFEGSIVGHGDYRYRVRYQWGAQDPAKIPVGNCHEMVMDSKKRLILLTDHVKNNIIVYDRSGRVTDTWTLDFPGAHGLTINDEGGEEFLYITDSRIGRVIKTTLGGELLLDIEDPRKSGVYEDPCAPYRPTETAIGPNGDIYVADGYGSQWILQYDSKGQFIRKFGGKSITEGKFLQVHGITLDTRDPDNLQLIATARIKNAFKFFTLDGKYLRTLHLPGAYVSRAVIDRGLIYTGVCFSGDKPFGIPRRSGFVMVIDENERVISNPGGTEPVYVDDQPQVMIQSDPVFVHPHDVCVDDDTNLYIPQWNADRTYPVFLERV